MGMNKPDAFWGWNEPESAANTDYQPVNPYNHTRLTDSGHLIEFDDTKTRERIRVMHRSNTFIEMHPNGDEVHKIWGDGYYITLGDHNISIGVDDGNLAKKLNITVYGDVNMQISGNKVENIDGDVTQHIKGSYTQVVEGYSSVTSQLGASITAGGGTSGGLQIKAANVNMDGNSRIRGNLNAGNIYSQGRVDTSETGGMRAGIAGFVTPLGGVAVGFPLAVPGNIICVGTMNAGIAVNAGVAMNSPLSNFGNMFAIMMTDVVNTTIYDTHTHLGVMNGGGMTGSSTIQMA
jgi:hypothetical protein